jgi:hypothetical protein
VKKGIIFILLIIFLVFVGTQVVFASFSFFSPSFSIIKSFGGRIIQTKALEIQELEAMGYICMVPGSSISITPIGSPAGTPISYFILPSKTNTTPMVGQLILGKYSMMKIVIPCIRAGYPPMFSSVSLNKVTIFGVSKI